jgi:glycine/D-amino acid oxidase-like deaminating enzyme
VLATPGGNAEGETRRAFLPELSKELYMSVLNREHGIHRRDFLGLAGTAVMMSAFSRRTLFGRVADATPTVRTDGTVPMVFHEPAEVLICGSTLFACDLAVRSARAGHRTVLAMERVNPFFEGITCLRSWVDAGKIPDLIRPVVTQAATSEVKAGRAYFNASKAALDIEDRLCEAGVRFLYNTPVAGALGHGGHLAGVVFGGKTGLFAIEAGLIVDATPDATIARTAGATTVPQSGPRRYHYVVDLAQPVPPRTVKYTATNGARVTVDIHHYCACFDVELDSRTTGPFALVDDFAQVYAACLECPWQGDERRFRSADGYLCSGVDRLEAAESRVADLYNLLVFGPQGIPGNTVGSLALKNPTVLFTAFPNALKEIEAGLRPVSTPRPTYTFWNKGVPQEATQRPDRVQGLSDHGFDEPGATVANVLFHPPQAALSAEVLVVGGGTSGNAAAYASARLGMKTVCLERGLELGGTNTLGGVTNLWFGRRTKAFEDYYRAMEAQDDGLNAPGFFRGVSKVGCRVLFHSAITGVAHSDRKIRSVYVITPLGLTAVQPQYCIDATGDGSVAAWAGCGYTFGGEHDEMTLWGSFGAFRPGRQEALRQFLSPCDERSALDTTRFILAMRRNSRGGHGGGDWASTEKHVPPPFYVAPRESRHIRGGKTVTFLDLLAGRRFRDGVLRAESNPDIKGLGTSDAIKAGFLHTDRLAAFQVTIPYTALIPDAIDNIIIAGKAYSATHDAVSTARMQRDLVVMGLVSAEAVHLATEKKVLLRNIPIPQLQQILIAKQMLQPQDVAEDDLGLEISAEALAARIAAGSSLDACLPESALLCLLPRPQALAALQPHAQCANRALQRVLCHLSVPEGIDAYLAQVEAALNEIQLSKELYGKGTSHIMPDQGYAPVAALMLGNLTHARDRRTVPLLSRLTERMNIETDELQSNWGYFFALACGFERLACPEGVAPLKRVLNGPILKNRVITRADDLRRTADYLGERYAYLRMALSRALIRCGEPDGALELCTFLNEARVCLARAARAELVAGTGQDFGFDQGRWQAWIQQHRREFAPNPLTTPFA